MTPSRTVIGGTVGLIVGLLWYSLGLEAVLVALGVGVVGLIIGWVLDHPGRIAEYLQRLERE